MMAPVSVDPTSTTSRGDQKSSNLISYALDIENFFGFQEVLLFFSRRGGRRAIAGKLRYVLAFFFRNLVCGENSISGAFSSSNKN